METQYLENIKKGMKVQIATKRGLSSGAIEEIAARTTYHPDGIMVRLKNGDVGRVQKILQNLSESESLIKEIKKLIEKGENFHIEFKSEALWSITYNPQQLKESKSSELREYGQKASKIIIARSIASFLNSDGGSLILGVKENKDRDTLEILGLAEDFKKLKKPTKDEYRRVITDEILRTFLPSKIYNHLNDYISFDFVEIDGKTILWIKIKKSDSRVFLNLNGREIFFIRVDAETRALEGEKLVDYCIKTWGAR